jgi:hypothetical protein
MMALFVRELENRASEKAINSATAANTELTAYSLVLRTELFEIADVL